MTDVTPTPTPTPSPTPTPTPSTTPFTVTAANAVLTLSGESVPALEVTCTNPDGSIAYYGYLYAPH